MCATVFDSLSLSVSLSLSLSLCMPPHTTQIHSATLESGVLDDAEVLDCLRQFKRTRNIRLGLSLSGTKQGETLSKALEIPCDPAAPAGCVYVSNDCIYCTLNLKP